jgi:hypothetical protein
MLKLLGAFPILIYLWGFISLKSIDTTVATSPNTMLSSYTPSNYSSVFNELESRYKQCRAGGKVIILLIDAYRYDYLQRTDLHSNWTDKYTHFSKLIAEPPTSTTQKLKSILSGTQSVLIEIAKSFGSLQALA